MSQEKKKEQTQSGEVDSQEDFIKKLKHKHKVDQVISITLDDGEGGELVGYFKLPGFPEAAGYYAQATDQTKILRAGRMLLTTCFLEGDRSLVDDDDNVISTIQQIGELLPQKEVEVKEEEEKASDGKKIFKVIDEDKKVFRFKKPDFDSIGVYIGNVEADPVMSTYKLLYNCKYDGDESILNDPFKVVAVGRHVDEIINVKTSRAVKF